MPKKKLTIKGITFPDFIDDKNDDDNSKKNFRLIFYIGFTDKDGNEAVTVVSKPAERHWQWRKESKDAYLKPKPAAGNSVELDTGILRTGDGNKIPPSSQKIAEIDGDITDVTVQFMDVHDSSPLDVVVKKILPKLLETWKETGFNPIDLAPLPGVVTGVLKDNFKLDEMAGQAADFFAKSLKDKLLHSISQEYKGEKTFVLKEENVKWNPKKHSKTGTYGVTIGVA